MEHTTNLTITKAIKRKNSKNYPSNESGWHNEGEVKYFNQQGDSQTVQRVLRTKFYKQISIIREADKTILGGEEMKKPLFLRKLKPNYKTDYGVAYLGDTLELIKSVPDKSISLIITSPPYGLRKKKEYGNANPEDYVNWFMPFAEEFKRVLKDNGSFVLNIGGGWEKGKPTRSLYPFELLIKLCKIFHLAEDFIWHKPAALPTPAEWVTIRRIRVKDAIEYVWWLSKTSYPKADNRKVLTPYSDSMKNLLKNGYTAKLRPSGHKISDKFKVDNRGAIPPNFLSFSNTESNSYYLRMCQQNEIKPHPARFPLKLPEFFINFLTDKRDIVFDPFAGSNVTGEAAEKLERRWLAFELKEDYLKGSRFRFNFSQKKLHTF